jgi:hypothetical protein
LYSIVHCRTFHRKNSPLPRQPNFELATQRFRLFSACLPHHAGTSPRIAKELIKVLNYVRAVSVVTLRNQRILDGAAKRKSLNALRSPVGGEFLLQLMPQTFSVLAF